MKKINRLIAIPLISMAFHFSAISQIISYPVGQLEQLKNPDGFIYLLPKHKIKVDVYITKTENFKGTYSDFATKLLGITDYITKNSTSFEISGIKLSTIAEPDTSQIYFAEVPKKIEDNQRIMINLTNDGFISGMQVVDNEKIQFLKSENSDQIFSDLLKPALIEKTDTIIRRVSIDTTIFEERVPRRSISEKSIEQQAREIAEQIYKIEDSKQKLITGYQEVNYSKESMEFMLKKLNVQEREFLAHFKGSTLKSTDVVTFYYLPEKLNEDIATLFKFNTSEGIVSSNQSGDAINIDIKPLNSYGNAKDVEKLRLNSKRKVRGVFYRIPESAQVSVKQGGRILASDKFKISQLGILSFLPHKNLAHVDFDTDGSLKTLIIQ